MDNTGDAADAIDPRHLQWLGVLLSLGLVAFRWFEFDAEPILLLYKSLLHPAGLARNPLVQAMISSPYSLVPKVVAAAAAKLGALGIGPQISLAALEWVLCGAYACLMYRFAEAMTGSALAGFLAAIFVGADMPFVMADAPFCIPTLLRRALSMPPLLWGLLSMAKGRRWKAVFGAAASTYLHAIPAVFVWPVVIIDDFAGAAAGKTNFRDAGLRLAAAAGLLLPLFLSTAGGSPIRLDPDYVRMDIYIHANIIAGIGMLPADWVFMLEALALIALISWRRWEPHFSVFAWLSIAVSIGFLAFGRLAYHGYMAHWPGIRFWIFGAQLQPWIALYLIELAGQLVLCKFAADELRADDELIYPVLVFMASSFYHDHVLRLFCIGVCAAILAGRRKAGIALTVVAVLPPLLYSLNPAFTRAAAGHLGFQGGIFSLPAFQPGAAAAIAGALLFGVWMRSQGSTFRHAAWTRALAAAMIFLWAGGARWVKSAGVEWRQSEAPLNRMADWIRGHTPDDSAILVAPLDWNHAYSNDYCRVFMSLAERSVFACSHFGALSMQYGAQSAPMMERLRELGVNFKNVGGVSAPPTTEGTPNYRHWRDFTIELDRVESELTPEKAKALAARYNLSYILVRSGRPWPGKPLHQEKDFLLYAL